MLHSSHRATTDGKHAAGSDVRGHVGRAVAAAGLGTWTYDARAGTVRMDAVCRTIVGDLTSEVLDGVDVLGLIHPDDRQRVETAMRRTFRSEAGAFDVECRVVGPEGRWRWVRGKGRAYAEHEGGELRSVYATGVLVDVTERHEKVLDALALERRRLQAVLAQMPSGLSIAEAPSGRLILHNDEAVRLLRHPLLASETIDGYLQYGAVHADGTPYDPEEYPIARAARRGEVVRQEMMHYRRGDGSRAILSVNAAPVRDADGEIVFAVSTFHDVTDRQASEEALERTRAHFRRALDDSGLVAARVDRELRYVWIYNPHPDFDAEAVVGRRDDEIDEGPGVEALMQLKREVIERGESVQREIAFERSDGARYYDVKGVPQWASDGTVTGLTTISRDVTQQKGTEQTLRRVSRRLMQAEENERRHIARELHDEMGGLLAALQMSLKMIAPKTAADEHELEEARSIAQMLIDHVRKLSLDLRPTVLDDMGLAPALQWFFSRFSERADVTFDFHHELAERERLPAVVETTAFRIVQEAVTNAVRHARTERVQVLVHREPDHLALHVIDEGIGFDEAAQAGANSTGLSSIRERARLIGGTAVVESEAGVGTRVTARLPLHPANGS